MLRHLPSPTTWWRATLVGIVVLAVLTAAKLAFPAIGQPTPFLTYFAAILVAAWQGGLIAGLVITGLSAAAGVHWFILGAPYLEWDYLVAQPTVFVLEGIVISWLAARSGREHAWAVVSAGSAYGAVDRSQTVLDALDVGVTMQDTKGRLVYANTAAARLSGHASAQELLATSASEMLGRFEVLDADGRPLSLARLPKQVMMTGHEPQEMLVQFRARGHGEIRYSQVGARAIKGADGKLRFVANTFRDVTEQRKQAEALRISQEWFATALQSIGDAVIATDPEGRVTFMNPVAERLTGWPLVEAERRPLVEVFAILNEETRATVESPVDKVIREGVVVGLANHTILVCKDGSEFAIDDSAAPIRDSDDTLVGVVLVFRDVTQARRESARRDFLARATETLGSSLDYTTTLATVAKLAVPQMADWCAVDMLEDGEIRRLAVAHVDPAKVRLVEEIERRFPWDPEAKSGVPEVLRTGRAEWIPELPASLLDATARDEEHLRLIRELQLRSWIAVPLVSGGRACGVITLVMAESKRIHDADDLAFATELAARSAVAVENARLFRAVEHARSQAVLATRAKDDFLAMLGHELRNPLAPIMTALEVLETRSVDKGERARTIIGRQVRAMVRLVDDLLDVSRITHGRVELVIEDNVDIARVVDSGLEVAAPLIQQRRHHAEVEVAAGLVVKGDPQRLIQVFANLLTNAAKYSEPGGRITIRGERDGDEVVVRLRDTGVGIPPEMLPRIFDVFVQQAQAIDRAQGGLGLGLAIVKGLVELHGGRVSVHSDGVGQGSEFVVRLPAAPVVAAAPSIAAPWTGPRPSGLATRVLIVDDNADALEMLAEMLRFQGYQTYAATDADSALALAREVQPTIALLDIGLPIIDGYELGHRLRAIPGLQDIELIAVTGYGQPSDHARSTAAGFVAHLVKPVDIEEIRRLLASMHAPDVDATGARGKDLDE
jgi:PAS domain S-box-containing protein